VRHFGGGKVWTDVADIVEVLDYVARTAMTNHTHFPDGGGLDLESASLSGETGCLALQFDSRVAAVVGKPEMLELVVPDRDPLGEWAYFRLELSELKPTGLEDNIEYGYEQLTEVYPGQYDRFERLDSEVPLPGSARAVSRYLQGAFLTIPKASRYNANPQTYDGRHSRMSADQFKQYVVAEIEQLWRSDNYGVDRRTGRKTSLS
jgi:serine/threonine-protein kinase